jgi:hypothetical protein
MANTLYYMKGVVVGKKLATMCRTQFDPLPKLHDVMRITAFPPPLRS